MLKKFLKEVIVIIVGKQAEEIADLLENKNYVNEFLIAKKLNITINQTRNILYKLSEKGLVSSIRKKDKKKGWYTYFWRIEISKALEFLEEILKNKISQIDYQIKSRETKDFYVCEKCNIEFSEENALLHNFTCNECGGIFSLKDNQKVVKEFKKQKEKAAGELAFVKEELKNEREKEDKHRLKSIKKGENAKKKEAKKKREERAKNKKLEKKPGKKKKVKKKTKKKVKRKASKKHKRKKHKRK